MIKVTVELISANGHERDRLLGVGLIANVGGDARHGNYSVILSKMAPKDREAWKRGTVPITIEIDEALVGDVVQFDRERRGCWDLLFQALRPLVGARNPVPEVVVPVSPAQTKLRTPGAPRR